MKSIFTQRLCTKGEKFLLVTKTSMTSVILFFTLILSYTTHAQFAAVNPPTGGFAIDGGLRANTPTSPTPFAANQGDWYPGAANSGTGGSVFTEAGVPIFPATTATSGHVTDNYTSNDSIFTTGSKFNDYVSNLHWFVSSAPNKNDINNALYHVSRDVSNDQWIFISGDRLSTSGTSYIDFELLQGTISLNSNGTFTGTPATGKNSGGGRTENDIVLSMEYTNGGSKPNVLIYQWKKSGTTWSYQQITPSDTLAAHAFAETNRNGTESNLPYSAFGSTTYQQFAFVEAAIDISYLLRQSGLACEGLNIRTMWVKTKASASSTAALKDFISPISVNFSFGSSSIDHITPKCANDNTAYLLSATPAGGTFTGTGIVDSSNGSYYFRPSLAGAGKWGISYTFSGCSAKDSITVNALPAAPGTSPVSYCQNATASALTATGTGLLWYTSATGGTGSATAPTPSTGTAGTTSYWVSQTNTSGCEGPRAELVVTVNALPAAPGTSPIAYCQNATASALTATAATGDTLLWYTSSTGGTGSKTAPTPSTATAGQTSYWVSQKNANTCEGPRAELVVTVNALPAAPGTSPVSYCLNATASPLTATAATGDTLLWYTAATGGTGSKTAPTPSTANAGQTSYWVSQKDANTCEGPRAELVVTVNDLPTSPGASIVPITCTDKTFSVKVTSPTTGWTYTISQEPNNNNSYSPITASGSDVIFTGLTFGDGYSLSVKNGNGCVSAADNCGTATGALNTVTSNIGSSIKISNNETTVKAYPNPFNTQVKFVVNAAHAGNGTLEIFNIVGQKVKTVYHGHVAAGVNNFDMNLPGQKNANLIYRFILDNKVVTGKLIQLNQ